MKLLETPEGLSTTFYKNSVVKLKDKYADRDSLAYKDIIGKVLVVDACYYADLGDMIVEIIRFNPMEGVQNPYLAEHFEPTKVIVTLENPE